MHNYIKKLPAILLAVGHCGSGKSVAVRYTIESLNTFEFVVVVSNTAAFNNDYDFLKTLNINHRIYNAMNCDRIIETVMNIQERSIKENQAPKKCLLVFDDILGSLSNSKTFTKLITTYRHFNISIFLTAQFVKSSFTTIRELSSYILVFTQNSQDALKGVYESYFSDIGTFSKFKEYFAGLKEYQFFFVDRPGKKRFKMRINLERKQEPEENPLDKKKREFLEKFN